MNVMNGSSCSLLGGHCLKVQYLEGKKREIVKKGDQTACIQTGPKRPGWVGGWVGGRVGDACMQEGDWLSRTGVKLLGRPKNPQPSTAPEKHPPDSRTANTATGLRYNANRGRCDVCNAGHSGIPRMQLCTAPDWIISGTAPLHCITTSMWLDKAPPAVSAAPA